MCVIRPWLFCIVKNKLYCQKRRKKTSRPGSIYKSDRHFLGWPNSWSSCFTQDNSSVLTYYLLECTTHHRQNFPLVLTTLVPLNTHTGAFSFWEYATALGQQTYSQLWTSLPLNLKVSIAWKGQREGALSGREREMLSSFFKFSKTAGPQL